MSDPPPPSNVSLATGTLSILIGQPPPLDTLACLRDSFSSSSPFRQVITLSSQKLVQLCNFVRRCRKEKDAGQRHAYLVILHLYPHREAWHLLGTFRSLNLTMVVCGGVCTSGAVREVFEFAPTYILEWYMQRRHGSTHPVLFVTNLVTRQSGVAHTLSPTSSLRDIYASWLRERRPDIYERDSEQASSSPPPPRRASPAHATTTMSMARACQLLDIAEADTRDAARVRRAYFARARLLHPDKQTNDAERVRMTALFADVNEAKRYLDSLG
jgi:hypothetical protein